MLTAVATALATLVPIVILALVVVQGRSGVRYGARPAPVTRRRPRAGRLVRELYDIGSRAQFLREPGMSRTREIGRQLCAIKGKRAMLDAHDRVAARLGRLRARELELAWDGIGSWRG